MTDWRTLARELAEELRSGGAIRSDAWAEAVRNVPRHELVGRYYTTDDGFHWNQPDLSTEEWLAAAYRDQTLVTGLSEFPLPDEMGGGTYQVATSSSTLPSLMLWMLERLDVRDGHRVLEIGTGTGYNAALLSHRLGDANVTSVDIDPALINTARERLARIGYAPTLVAADGTSGCAQRSPYDRIIATCAVPAVPGAWIDQLADDGLILVNIQGSLYAGNLVSLRRSGPDTVTGRFLDGDSGFMPIRHSLTDEPPGPPPARPGPRVSRATRTGPAAVAERTSPLAMLAQLQLAAGTIMSSSVEDGRAVTALSAPDGSRCEVATEPGPDGYEVVETSPTRLWSAVEAADRYWRNNGCPNWSRLGLTVTAGRHQYWLDSPDNLIAGGW